VVICNVNPGFERPNPRILNLRAQPRAEVQIGRNTMMVRARAAAGYELDRYWPRLVMLRPAYQTFYDRGGQRSVFVLEPDRRVMTPPPGADRLQVIGNPDAAIFAWGTCAPFPGQPIPAVGTPPGTAGPPRQPR
jgi:hypothetical protein